ncbi:MAG: hypothetical protein QW303_05410 [Nitrososphaerota archaeon]
MIIFKYYYILKDYFIKYSNKIKTSISYRIEFLIYKIQDIEGNFTEKLYDRYPQIYDYEIKFFNFLIDLVEKYYPLYKTIKL